MQSLYSMVFGSKPDSTEADSSNQEESKDEGDEKTIDRVADFMPEEMMSHMLMFTLNDATLYNLKSCSTQKSGKRQNKECMFMNTSISLGNMPIFNSEDKCNHNTPVIIMSNDDYDEDQDQQAEERLPVTEEMIFMRYTDGADDIDDDDNEQQPENETHGFVFFYPELNICKIIECEIDSIDKVQELKEFEDWLCRILYVLSEGTQIRDDSSPLEIRQKQKKMFEQYCIKASLDVLQRQTQIIDIFNLSETDQKAIKGRQRARRNAKTMEERVKKQRAETLAHKMSQLKIGQEDVKDLNSLTYTVEERLIQVLGHFYRYDSVIDANVPIKDGLFLTIDRISGGDQNFGGRYQLSVLDPQQQISYCSVEITSDRIINLVQKDQTMMWTGNIKPSGELPAWAFYITEKAVLGHLKGVLCKTITETRNREMAIIAKEEAEDAQSDAGNEREWLEAAMLGADNDDCQSESENQSEQDQLDYYDPDNVLEAYEDYATGVDIEMEDRMELDRLEQEEVQNQKLNEDLDQEFLENDNKECLQALGYNRAFVSQGPVVKIYKNDDDFDQHQSKLQYLMHMPLMKDAQGNLLDPQNMMLYNNEAGLLFSDQKTQSVFNYDLEKGAIIDQYKMDQDLVQLTNEFKNAQQSASQLIHGITTKSMFTMDPRLDKQSKIAVKKDYKVNPTFSCMAATLAGGLAIGSADGKIRLYKSLGGNANTLLPGLGDPIIAIEVSRDGNWVLATTRQYLLLVPTLCDNGKTGFDFRMGKQKPNPIKLWLSARDVAQYNIRNIHFKPARFNNFNQAGEETAIVTSTADLLITWKFSKVKKGNLNAYKIRKLDTMPVDNQFQVDRPEHVLCTDAKNVGVVKRKRTVTFAQ